VSAVVTVVDLVLYAFLVCLWVRVILSYFPVTPGSGAAGAARVVSAVTEPILGPIRRILPTMRAGGGAFDLSPILVSIAVLILIRLI
jgi:YggT family protein